MTFDLRGNSLDLVRMKSFSSLQSLALLVDEYATCCFMKKDLQCLPSVARPSSMTCKRMLPNLFLRITMWIVGIAAVMFNLFVIGRRFMSKMGNKIQNTLVLNLAVSDLFMGVSMLILSSADFYYADYFPNFSLRWINGSLCKSVAVLSTLSSEASVFLITFIGMDRYLGVKYPLGVHQGLGTARMRICVFFSWLISLIISVGSIVLELYIPGSYDVSEVCVGLPMVKKAVTVGKTEKALTVIHVYNLEYTQDSDKNPYDSVQWNETVHEWTLTNNSYNNYTNYRVSVVSGYDLASYLSIIVFIGLNSLCFSAVAVFYINIFQIASTSSSSIQSTAKGNELKMAVRMSAVVLTDFCCWVPLAFVCLLVQCGATTVGPDMYAWTVGLILPINSALNPFLYTLATVIADRLG